MDHYVTTANTVQGTLNDYLVKLDDRALGQNRNKLDRRDFSASPMMLSQTPVAKVTREAIVREPGVGLIAFHDIKARRGDIQCQVFKIGPQDPAYRKYNCRFNESGISTEQELQAQILSVRAMREAGGQQHIVMKTTATYDEMVGAFMRFGDLTAEQAKSEMREDETNRSFCVTAYDADVKPYGKISTKYTSQGDEGCIYGPYVNFLDYIRQNTGNPDYFGFTEIQKKQRLISGNRANLWLLDTSAAIGPSDRMYRWQMLGSEKTYNMSDIVKYLSYPYVSYQIINADRLDVVYQAINKGMYPRYPNDGSENLGMYEARPSELSETERTMARQAAERRAEEDR